MLEVFDQFAQERDKAELVQSEFAAALASSRQDGDTVVIVAEVYQVGGMIVKARVKRDQTLIDDAGVKAKMNGSAK